MHSSTSNPLLDSNLFQDRSLRDSNQSHNNTTLDAKPKQPQYTRTSATKPENMDFTTWKCCKCHHKGNWIQIPGCGGYITVFLKQVQCEHLRCKKCDKLSGFTDDDDVEDQERRKRKKGLMAWLLRTG